MSGNEKKSKRTRRLREAAFNVDRASGTAFAVIGGATLRGTLTGAKTALAGTLDQTLTMILHGYLLFYHSALSRVYFETPIVFFINRVVKLYCLRIKMQASLKNFFYRMLNQMVIVEQLVYLPIIYRCISPYK